LNQAIILPILSRIKSAHRLARKYTSSDGGLPTVRLLSRKIDPTGIQPRTEGSARFAGNVFLSKQALACVGTCLAKRGNDISGPVE